MDGPSGVADAIFPGAPLQMWVTLKGPAFVLYGRDEGALPIVALTVMAISAD